MAFKHREDVVGKRFAALKNVSNLKDLSGQEWRLGVIRAASEKDIKSSGLQVLVEFDGEDWQKREWIKVHGDYSAILVECSLVLSQREHPDKPRKKCLWPALTFQSIVDLIGLAKERLQPIQFLVDQRLVFVDREENSDYKETSKLEAVARQAAQDWLDYQDGQSILITTPSILVGYRVQVYRSEGTTQWYTAVIQQYYDTTKELVLLDDTVLEVHYESAELIQIIPLDGVVESILKGTASRVTPRRSRACKDVHKDTSNSGNAQNTLSQEIVLKAKQPKGEAVIGKSEPAVGKQSIVVKQEQVTKQESIVAKSHRESVRKTKNREIDKAVRTESVIKERKRASKRVGSEPKSSKTTEAVRESVIQRTVSEPVKNELVDTYDGNTDMHYKKLRILGANSENSNPTPVLDSNAASSPTLKTIANQLAADLSGRVEKLSESSVDGCSSGYNSATTTDTISPRTADSIRCNQSATPTMTSSHPMPSSSVPPNHSVLRGPNMSPGAVRLKTSDLPHINASSPLLIDTGKEHPIIPYRDPELLKRDEEVRKLQPLAAVGGLAPGLTAANLAAVHQQQAAAMMNPMSQLGLMQMSQLQLMEQFRQMQAMQTLTPLHLQLLQQQQQLQHQYSLEALYRQRQQNMSPMSAPWLIVPPYSEKTLNDLREHERLAMDHKERDRSEREKLEKERAEKERQEREQKERHKERARILQESAAAAVNQHFSESLRRAENKVPLSHTPPAPSIWNNKTYPDNAQPQDLSINHKKDRESSSQEKDRERENIVRYNAGPQQTDNVASNVNSGVINMNQPSSDNDKQKGASRQHEVFVRSPEAAVSRSPASQARLAEEHFRKAAAQMQPKAEPAEYSLYGYQSFPNRFLSKDQLNQEMRKDEVPNDQSSPIAGHIKRTIAKPSGFVASQYQTVKSPADIIKSEPAAAGGSAFSDQLIQKGLVPNPAYASSTPCNISTSNSISALVNMSMYAGNQIVDKRDKNTSQSVTRLPVTVKAEQTTLQSPQILGMVHSGSLGDIPQQVAAPSNANIMKSFKSFVENAVTNAFYKDIVEEQNKKKQESEVVDPKAEPATNGVIDTDSDTLSAPSPTLSVQTQDSKPSNAKKLKKEWAQRHSGEGNQSETTTSASETESEVQGAQKQKPKKRKSDSSQSVNGLKKAKNGDVSSGPRQNSRSSGGSSITNRKQKSTVAHLPGTPASGGGDSNSDNDEQHDSMRQLAEVASVADRIEVPYASKPLVKVNITTLKKTGQPFVQDGSCIEMAPKLTKCRECKMTPNQRNKKIPNIFCRFYAFRRLKFSKNGQICISGFCEPTDAEQDDIQIWLPLVSLKHRKITASDVKTAKYIVANVGDEFCRLVEQERECASWCNPESKRVWKRAVQGVREMCDVCDTTLFNTHWVCHRCGFVVCIDCYRVKRKVNAKYSDNVNEENRRWLTCSSNKNHEPDKLMLTSIIPGNALKITGDLIHRVRKKHGIKANCPCGRNPVTEEEPPLSPTPNGVSQHLLNAVAVTKGGLVNGHAGDKLSVSYPQAYRQSTLLSSSLDNKALSTYSDDAVDPLSLLADVAAMAPSTNGSSEHTTPPKPAKDEIRMNGSVEEMDCDGAEKKPCLTLRKLLTKRHVGGTNPVAGDKKIHDLVNTVVETNLLSSLNPHAGTASHAERVRCSAAVPELFTHYQRRSGSYLSGRKQPIPVCNLTETSAKFPDIPHSWLCNGQLLRLLDAKHPCNFTLFNQRWVLGQPIIVSNVSKQMKVEELWTPEAFSREFGHIKHDLIDCRRNEPLTGYQIKHFWDGFEDSSKRLRDAEDEPLILKLKDWPTGEDFAESMPLRFEDLMGALPMPEYTKRNGELNLAGRLPDFFVKPDLGPKMYNAYGLAHYPESGTTNLHLDVSDAVNVMVYVAHEKALEPDVMHLIDESDCDEVMKRRITVDKEVPGALWHIFDACDADKMRDMLNKYATEQGLQLEPYHDPIHDQQFYLNKQMRRRLAEEYGVTGYAIIQCAGDAVFIPAGAPHQVQNLNGCIKVAEDFVSPEHLHHCFNLTQEFRHLSNTHTNHEDKLQVKNIIYHAIKDAVAILDKCDRSL